VETRLQHSAGQQLVIVHYSPTHNPREGWVSNAADIDSSKIVWAQDMGTEKNAELIHYFTGWHIWDVFPDENPIQLLPYSSTGRQKTNETPRQALPQSAMK
jgi:hypothetical protein